MSAGVIYMAWGDNAVQQAEESIRSLWKHDRSFTVMVVGDAAAGEFFNGHKGVEFHQVDIDPFDATKAKGYKFLAGRIKPLLAGISQFERTLYVDADTLFKRSPKIGFELLDRWDVALAETQTRSLVEGIAGIKECRATSDWVGSKHILYHNSGMIFWKKNERTSQLFDLWNEEWNRFKGWDEQVALLRALIRSDCMFLTLPHTWNCYHDRDSHLLHHWFGGGQARIEKKGKYRVVPAERPKDARKLVKVEIAPGRFAKCHEGDEEKVMEHYRKLLERRHV
jgi:hypothetical protein